MTVEQRAFDVVLSDPWYYGGRLVTKHPDFAALHLGLSVGMHSGVDILDEPLVYRGAVRPPEGPGGGPKAEDYYFSLTDPNNQAGTPGYGAGSVERFVRPSRAP